MRIGRGEFQQVSPAGDAEYIDQHARQIFLDTIAEVAPHVLTALADLLPLYRNASPLLNKIEELLKDELGDDEYETDQGTVSFEPEPQRDWISGVALQTSEPRPEYIEAWQQLEPLRTALRRWANEHHLNIDWILFAARDTLGQWQFQGPPERLSWHYPFVIAYVGNQHKFSFQPRGWAPEAETRAEATARLRTEFSQYLAKYLDGVERILSDSPGWRRTPAKRGSASENHFEWLVRYQVCGWSKSTLARDHHASFDTVDDALKRTAALIGIPLRPGKRGRPSEKNQTAVC